jgi:hypothetical protein
MIGRLWYPQLDAYDAVRRIAGLLALWAPKSPPSPERLFIADFYLANPPLLHRTHMSRDVRNLFHELGIGRPEKAFLNYPVAQILFQRMEEFQKQALRTLTGKGLVDLAELERGHVVPSDRGRALFAEKFVPLFDDAEHLLADFLVRSFARSDEDIYTLRRSTGLRRISR